MLVRPWLASLAFLLTLTQAGPEAAQVRRINAPLPTSADGGDVSDFKIDASETHVLFRTLDEVYGTRELWLASVDGSYPARRLHVPLPAGGEVSEYGFDPTGQGVVFVAEIEAPGRAELFRTLLAPGSSEVKLSDKLVPGGSVHQFAITPDGLWVAYVADRDVAGKQELYSVPLTGGTSVRLSGVHLGGIDVVEVQAVEGSAQFVYRTTNGNGPFPAAGLYRAPVDGLTGPTSLLDAERITRILLSPDGSRTVVRAEAKDANRFELYSVNLAGSPDPIKVSGPMQPGGNVFAGADDVVLTSDSQRVLYVADQDNEGVRELYSARLDGSEAHRVNGDLPAGFEILDFLITPDGQTAVLRGGGPGMEERVRSVPVDGSSPSIPIYYTAIFTTIQGMWLTEDASRVIFHRRGSFSLPTLIVSVPIDGTDDTLRLFGPEDFDGTELGSSIGDVIPLSDRIVFSTTFGDEVFQGDRGVFQTLIDGSGPIETIEADSTQSDVLDGFQVAAGRVIFRRDSNGFGSKRLYSQPFEASIPENELNGPLPLGEVIAGVEEFLLEPTGTRAAYIVRGSVSSAISLWSVRLRGATRPQLLESSTTLRDVVLTADGVHALFQGQGLQAVPLDGSAPPHLLSPEHSYYDLSPNGTQVLYLEDGDLYLRSVDGKGSPQLLASDSFGSFLPDGSIVHRPTLKSEEHLYHRYPNDGVSPSYLLIQDSQPFDLVYSLDLVGDRAVYFRSRFDGTDYVNRILSVPLVGGSSTDLTSFVPTQDNISSHLRFPDDHSVLFAVDPPGIDFDGTLYRAAADGSTPPLPIAPINLGLFEVSPNGEFVILPAIQESFRYDLFSVPLSGATPPVPLGLDDSVFHSGPLMTFDPTGTHVAVTTNASGGPLTLRGSPVDGSGPAVTYQELVATGHEIHFNATGTRLFTLNQGRLRSIPVDASEPLRIENAPLPPGANVLDFEFTPNRESLIYLATSGQNGNGELFQKFLGRKEGRADRPAKR